MSFRLSPSHVRTVVTAATVAAAEIQDTVPAGECWYLLSVKQTLTKGGAGGQPQPILQLVSSNGTVFWEGFGSSAAQALSTTCTYTWAPDQPLSGQIGATTDVHATAPLPEGMVLPGGYKIQTRTINTVGGTSNYGTPVYQIVDLNAFA